MVLQLTLLGYILRPIFLLNLPTLVMGYASFMVVVATLEAISRPQYTYKVGSPSWLWISSQFIKCHHQLYINHVWAMKQ